MDNLKPVFKLIIVPFLIGFYCCNSEKRVLNDADKTQHVVNKYLQTHPARTDTVTSIIPGDTVTTLLIAYDTTTVRDTVNHLNTIKVTQTVTKYINRVDTLIKVVTDNRLLQVCQESLANSDYDKKQATIDVKAAKVEASKYKLYFIVLCLCVAGGIVVLILKK